VRSRTIEQGPENNPEPRISVLADPWATSSTGDEKWEVTYEIEAGENELWEISDD
jgi:hypothetical protein